MPVTLITTIYKNQNRKTFWEWNVQNLTRETMERLLSVPGSGSTPFVSPLPF